MKVDKKQQKFHDSLLKMLYPPPPSPDPSSQDEEEDNKLIDTLYNLSKDVENYENDESPSISEDNVGSEKLTRAQRKRLRKKKLKETASQRRKIIGPLLPCSGGDEGDCGGGVLESVRQNGAEGNVQESVRQNAAEGNVSESVRQNAAEESVSETVRQNAAEGDTTKTDSKGSCSKQSKLKQRRKFKKLGGEKLSSSSMETSASIEVKDHQLGSNDEKALIPETTR